MREESEIATPEAWDLDRVRLVVQAISDSANIAETTSLSPRHVGYHIQAAKILGWIQLEQRVPVLTDTGRALLQTPLGSANETSLMRASVQRSDIVRVVVPALLENVSVDELVCALRESPHTRLAESTARKRAATLVHWRQRVVGNSSTAPDRAENVAQERLVLPTNKILLIQLSDIHIKTEADLQRLIDRAPKVVSALAARSEANSVDACLLLLSGDIAFSGTRAQYEWASSWLEILCEKLDERFAKVPVYVVIVPGNHDCDFSHHKGMRERLVTAVEPAAVDQSYVDGCTVVQQHFWEFAERWHKRGDRLVSKSVALEIHAVNISTRVIRVYALNTAWMSTQHERQGNLIFPQAGLDVLLNDSASSPDVVIATFHHGDNWLESNNARDFRRAIEQNCDAVLTGHEHSPDYSHKEGSLGQSSWRIEGGVLQDNSNADNSSFNALVLDLEALELQVLSFAWIPTDSMYVPTRTSSPTTFQRNQFRVRSIFQIEPTFASELDQPGEAYRHPRKDPIRLSDVFVYPDVRERLYDRTGIDAENTVRDVLEHVRSRQQVMFLAAELAGKTALARALFKDMHQRGLVPVLLDGRKLDDPSPISIHKQLDSAFERAYGAALLESFRQLEPSRRAVIVDDFHCGPLQPAGKDQIAAVLSRFAQIVVVFVDETFELATLRNYDGAQAHLWTFTHDTILPLGHRVRYELISNWCSHGRGYSDAPQLIAREIEQRDRTITHLLGKNFLPAYPGFVLLCLQQLEVKAGESGLGSFGHLYEALLTRNLLSGGAGSGMDLDAKQQFLSEFAFKIYCSTSTTLDSLVFEDCYRAYCDNFHVAFSREKIERELVASAVLEVRRGQFGFKYKYAYLFFVARYLRDHIEDDDIKDIVRNLCGRLYHEPSASTLLFLCHLSKHPFVLGTLLAQARSLFPGAAALDVETALVPLGQPRSASLLLPPDHQTNRKSERELRDKLEPRVSLVEQHEGLPPEVMQISAAFKTVQILGQILRGFPGSISGERKLEIATECYSLGLRAAQALLTYIVDGQSDIETLLEDVLVSRRPGLKNTPQELRIAAQRLLYDLCESMCLGTIQHISDAVGLQMLSRTYDEVLKKNGGLSFRVVDLAVHLDHFSEFPYSKLEDLLRDVHSKFSPRSLVRRLVWRYLYMFPMPQGELQSLCSKLDIKLTRALQSAGKGARR